MGEQVVTARGVLKALHQRFPGDRGWHLATEIVSEDKTRRADAIAWNIFTGEVHGIEIKCDKSDLASELKRPEKAGAFWSDVDFWWLAGPPGIVQDAKVPDGWGTLEVAGDQVVRRVPGVRLHGEPGRALATAFIRRLMQADVIQDLLAQEREVGRREGKNKAARARPAATYSKQDVDNAYRRGYNEARRQDRSQLRK